MQRTAQLYGDIEAYVRTFIILRWYSSHDLAELKAHGYTCIVLLAVTRLLMHLEIYTIARMFQCFSFAKSVPGGVIQIFGLMRPSTS